MSDTEKNNESSKKVLPDPDSKPTFGDIYALFERLDDRMHSRFEIIFEEMARLKQQNAQLLHMVETMLAGRQPVVQKTSSNRSNSNDLDGSGLELLTFSKNDDFGYFRKNSDGKYEIAVPDSYLVTPIHGEIKDGDKNWIVVPIKKQDQTIQLMGMLSEQTGGEFSERFDPQYGDSTSDYIATQVYRHVSGAKFETVDDIEAEQDDGKIHDTTGFWGDKVEDNADADYDEYANENTNSSFEYEEGELDNSTS